MRKGLFCTILAVILVCCTTLVYAQQATNEIMEELNKELEQEKVFLPRELKNMNKSLRNTMEQGVTKEDLKAILSDLKKKGLDYKEIKKTIESMNDLIKAGVEPKQAGNIVSQAAHLAKAQGLKGTALAAKVHEAIRIRKAEHERLKQLKKEQKQHIEQHKEQEKESHGMGLGHGKGKK